MIQIILKYITQFNDKLEIVINKTSVKDYIFSGGKLIINFKVVHTRKGISKFYEWSFIQNEDRITNLDDVRIFLKLNCNEIKKQRKNS